MSIIFHLHHLLEILHRITDPVRHIPVGTFWPF